MTDAKFPNESAWLFSDQETYLNSQWKNIEFRLRMICKYIAIWSSLTTYSPLTCLTTNIKSRRTFSLVTSSIAAILRLAMAACTCLIIGGRETYSVGMLNDGPLHSCQDNSDSKTLTVWSSIYVQSPPFQKVTLRWDSRSELNNKIHQDSLLHYRPWLILDVAWL